MENKTNEQKKCLCNEPFCAKCLSVNCEVDNCLVHTKEHKAAWWKRRGDVNKKIEAINSKEI